ncbi:MAG: hypothetical protein H6739_12210 [Alphaproteobacteria bacterium]|nr:hypothetical protein [Alphaproteobacteria bacterium]
MLPPLPSPFVGRAAEREALLGLLQPGAQVALVAQDGVGKNALARALVPALAERFPDGVAWVDAGRFAGLEGRRADATLTACVAALSPEMPMGSDLQQRTAQLRVALSRGRALLVLAHPDPETLAAVKLRGEGALLVLARPGEVPEGERLPLRPLPAAEGAALLSALAPDLPPERVVGLARALGGRTLALRALGVAVARGFSPPEGLERLDPLSGAVGRVVEALVPWMPEPIWAAWRAAALVVGDADAATLARVAGVDASACDLLVDMGLMSALGERLALHPAARPLAEAALAVSEDAPSLRLRHAQAALVDGALGPADRLAAQRFALEGGSPGVLGPLVRGSWQAVARDLDALPDPTLQARWLDLAAKVLDEDAPRALEAAAVAWRHAGDARRGAARLRMATDRALRQALEDDQPSTISSSSDR